MQAISSDIDLNEAARFLALLDPEATSFTFQTFDDSEGKGKSLARTLHGSLAQHASTLSRLNRAGAGVFVTINETDGTGRKAENIKRVRAVFIDLDGAPIQPVQEHAIQPHMIVESSPDRWHAYWKTLGIDLDDFRSIQEHLIDQFDADAAVKDLPRVMRLPGFLHQKYGGRFQTRIETAREAAPYDGAIFRIGKVPAVLPDAAPSETSEDVAAIIRSECEKLANIDRRGRTRNNTLNKVAYTLGGLVGAGLANEQEVRDQLLLVADAIDLTRNESNLTIDSGLTAGKKAPWSPKLILDPSNPMRTARKMLDDRYRHDTGNPLLLRHRQEFWRWDGKRFAIFTKEPVDAAVWSYTERAKAMGKQGPEPFKPNPERVNAIVHALRAVSQVEGDPDTPCWLSEGNDLPPPSEFMAVGNGLLHLPSCELFPPTPTFFNTSASSVAYDEDAAEPTKWLAFLDQIFGDDIEARQAVQEFFGYCLSTDTSQQKMLLMVGPPRSGKGTMARVLRELAGADSVAGPSMSSLSGDFGLEPLIPRPIAIISDARIGQRTDKAAVTERLLTISGEDTVSANRKNNSFWHGKLKTRFIVITNELPALSDGTGALPNRFIIVLLQTTFLGKEDPGLFDKLKVELPGILNWAIEGYQRLRKRGHFVQPASAKEALEDMMRVGSPVHAFVSECCEVGPDYIVNNEYLWEEWKRWAEANGNMSGSKAVFGKKLKEVVPGVRRKDGGYHDYYYAGLRISQQKQADDEAREARQLAKDNAEIPF